MNRQQNFDSLLPIDLSDYYVEFNGPIEKYTLVAEDGCDPFILNADDLEKLKQEATGPFKWFNAKIYDMDSMEIIFESKKVK